MNTQNQPQPPTADEMLSVLVEAKRAIRYWHDLHQLADGPDEFGLWAAYQDGPEMKPINKMISRLGGKT